MSSPMFEIPDHMAIGVDRSGRGPFQPEDPKFDHWECWCPDPECKEYEKDGVVIQWMREGGQNSPESDGS